MSAQVDARAPCQAESSSNVSGSSSGGRRVAGVVERREAAHLLARGDQADQLLLGVGHPLEHAVGLILELQAEPAVGADVLRVVGEDDQRTFRLPVGLLGVLANQARRTPRASSPPCP